MAEVEAFKILPLQIDERGRAASATGRRRGRVSLGVRNPNARLSEDQARAILASGKTCDEIAEEFGITAGQVRRIWAGQAWTHLERTHDIEVERRRRAATPKQIEAWARVRGVRHGMARLGEEQVRAILASRKTNREIAAEFGVSEPHVSGIRAGKQWAHLKGSVEVVKHWSRSGKVPTLEQLFERTVVDEHGCRIWQGSRDQDGYGRVTLRSGRWLVHRLAYTLAHGEIPDGLFVCHHCDVTSCVNPDHLFCGGRYSEQPR